MMQVLRGTSNSFLRQLSGLATQQASGWAIPSTSQQSQGMHHDSMMDPSPSSWDEAGSSPGPSQCAPPADGPQLCAVPKRKVSVSRRKNKRVWYHLDKAEEVAQCSFCGEVARTGHVFSGLAGNKLCTGACSPVNPKPYPAEYTPPC